MTKVYMIVGSSVDYDDHYKWNESVFINLKEAEDYKIELEKKHAIIQYVDNLPDSSFDETLENPYQRKIDSTKYEDLPDSFKPLTYPKTTFRIDTFELKGIDLSAGWEGAFGFNCIGNDSELAEEIAKAVFIAAGILAVDS